MTANASDLRIEVTTTDPKKKKWDWRVFVGPEIVEQGEAPSQKMAHQLAHDASQKHREDLHTQGHGTKKKAKEE